MPWLNVPVVDTIGPLHNPATWYGINFAGTQVTQRGFQNKGTHTSPCRVSFVLKVPLRNLRPSIINSVPCDRIMQRVYAPTKQQVMLQVLRSRQQTTQNLMTALDFAANMAGWLSSPFKWSEEKLTEICSPTTHTLCTTISGIVTHNARPRKHNMNWINYLKRKPCWSCIHKPVNDKSKNIYFLITRKAQCRLPFATL